MTTPTDKNHPLLSLPHEEQKALIAPHVDTPAKGWLSQQLHLHLSQIEPAAGQVIGQVAPGIRASILGQAGSFVTNHVIPVLPHALLPLSGLVEGYATNYLGALFDHQIVHLYDQVFGAHHGGD